MSDNNNTDQEPISFEMSDETRAALKAAAKDANTVEIKGEVKDGKIWIANMEVQYLHDWMDS